MLESEQNIGTKEGSKTCIFCEIVAGRSPAGIITESQRTLVIVAREDGYPLIVTKKHYDNVFDPDLPKITARELGEMQVKIARLLQTADQVTGVTIATNNGRSAGQIVNHLHTHIIPRRRGDRKVRMMEGESLSLDQIFDEAQHYREALIQL